jgi:15-cis-phytoene synthase
MTATAGDSQATFSSPHLEHSRAYCRDLTKRQAANFYHGMKLLPEPKRSAMYALYAYMRLVDDIADDDANERTLAQRRQELDEWQTLTHLAYSPSPDQLITLSPCQVWPAFIDLIGTYHIPQKIFDDMIAGQRQDLTASPIQTFADLHAYCYRVASVVGIASLYVWGFDTNSASAQETLQLATDRGVAFQLTNVLRDLREDASRNRCYLPQDELARFNVTPPQIASDSSLADNPAFLALMQFQIDRARSYYENSAPLDERIAADARPTLRAMSAIYRGILEKIAADPARVLTHRVRLSKLQKLLIAWRAMRS